MLEILMTGIGGQGTVLAAKLLAQAARGKGWKVRTAETIGMAQRGGSVISHVRIGDQAEEVYAPLINKGSADIVIAFEPAEALRVLDYLKPDGLMVCASSGVQPVTVALSGSEYRERAVTDWLNEVVPHFLLVDDERFCKQAGSRKVLNTILLASALNTGKIDISIADMKQAVPVCVKERFVALNLDAIDIVCEEEANKGNADS